MAPRPPTSTLFPYTTLFRSGRTNDDGRFTGHEGSAGLDGLVELFSRGCVCDRRSEEHTSELQSHSDVVCRLLLEKISHGGHPAGRRADVIIRRFAGALATRQ